MEINLKMKVPEDLDILDREERIKTDLDTIVLGIHNMIPADERKHIKIIDGDDIIHKYESFFQIAEIYRKSGKLGIIYVGKDFIPYTSN